jgi:hypothetical protein
VVLDVAIAFGASAVDAELPHDAVTSNTAAASDLTTGECRTAMFPKNAMHQF